MNKKIAHSLCWCMYISLLAMIFYFNKNNFSLLVISNDSNSISLLTTLFPMLAIFASLYGTYKTKQIADMNIANQRMQINDERDYITNQQLQLERRKASGLRSILVYAEILVFFDTLEQITKSCSMKLTKSRQKYIFENLSKIKMSLEQTNSIAMELEKFNEYERKYIQQYMKFRFQLNSEVELLSSYLEENDYDEFAESKLYRISHITNSIAYFALKIIKIEFNGDTEKITIYENRFNRIRAAILGE